MTRPNPNTPTFIVQSSPESKDEFYFAGRQKRSAAHGLLALMQAGVKLGTVDHKTYAQNAITLTDALSPTLIGTAAEQILISLVDEIDSREASFISSSTSTFGSGILDLTQARTKRDLQVTQSENVHILDYSGYTLIPDETCLHLKIQLADVNELVGEVPPPGVIDLLTEAKIQEFGVDRESLKVISSLKLNKAAFQYPIMRSSHGQKPDPVELEAITYGKLDNHSEFIPHITELPRNYFAD